MSVISGNLAVYQKELKNIEFDKLIRGKPDQLNASTLIRHRGIFKRKGEKMNSPESNPDRPIWPAATPLPDGIEVRQMVTEVSISQDEIVKRFGFHKSSIEGPNATAETHKDLRFAFMQFADYLTARLGKSREASLAFTALEEASMWSHKAIAATDPIDPEV